MKKVELVWDGSFSEITADGTKPVPEKTDDLISDEAIKAKLHDELSVNGRTTLDALLITAFKLGARYGLAKGTAIFTEKPIEEDW